MVTYKTLKERQEYHWDESKRIWDAAYGREMTPEEKAAYNFHEAEADVLGARIRREFPEEVAAAKAASKARLEQVKKFLAEYEPGQPSKDAIIEEIERVSREVEGYED